MHDAMKPAEPCIMRTRSQHRDWSKPGRRARKTPVSRTLHAKHRKVICRPNTDPPGTLRDDDAMHSRWSRCERYTEEPTVRRGAATPSEVCALQNHRTGVAVASNKAARYGALAVIREDGLASMLFSGTHFINT